MEQQIQQQNNKSSKKRSMLMLVLLLLLVTVTIGYAVLSATIRINGVSTIKNEVWDIEVPEGTEQDPAIECSEGVVCTIVPDGVDPDTYTPDDGRPVCTTVNNVETCTDPVGGVIWMEGDTVYFKHYLSVPKDKFEFTVDFANKGTIDAKLKGITKTVLNEAQDKFLTYDVTYADGSAITDGDKLKAGTQTTFKVTITYKDVATLPTAAELTQINNSTLKGQTGMVSLFTATYEQDR